MSMLIILRHVQVENANAISGLTYGFPSITHFLGYSHALSRKLQISHGISLDGCGVICHRHQVQCYQPGGRGDYVFAQSRNPLTKEGETSPIIEEGRMQLTVSLLLECNGLIANGDFGITVLKQHLEQLCPRMRLAGGTITAIRQVEIFAMPQVPDDIERFNRRQLRLLLPGFALLDRTYLLAEHLVSKRAEDPETELLDVWLDFIALKAEAEPILADGEDLNETTKANWRFLSKPAGGWLVPIAIGYRAISRVYRGGEVANSRDVETPFAFAESLYGIGEWCSPHRFKSIEQLLWRYQYKESEGWYLCKNNSQQSYETEDQEENFDY